jgi:hypothetical protein
MPSHLRFFNASEIFLGGTHAFRSNLFACSAAKRISTTIVAAMHLQINILTNPIRFSKP